MRFLRHCEKITLFFKITFFHTLEKFTFFKIVLFSPPKKKMMSLEKITLFSHFLEKIAHFFPNMTSLEKFTLSGRKSRFFSKTRFSKFMLFGEIRVFYNPNIIKKAYPFKNFKQKSWLQIR